MFDAMRALVVDVAVVVVTAHVIRLVAVVALASAVPALGGCTDSATSGAAARGRQIYLAQCVQCHASDPTHAGPVGPPLQGSSRALLEAKLLHGAYPPGYRPKRPTAVMPVQPQMAPEIDALAAFLK